MVIDLLLRDTLTIYRGYKRVSDGVGGFKEYPKKLKVVKGRLSQRTQKEVFLNCTVDSSYTHVAYTKEPLRINDIVAVRRERFHIHQVETFTDSVTNLTNFYKGYCTREGK